MSHDQASSSPVVPQGESQTVFAHSHILAFATGKPSEAFGEPYQIFDQGRFIARLPAPPYNFIHRVTRIEAEPWRMQAGGVIEAEYDVPAEAWYFAADRQPVMPFAILLEAALQSCGFMAAYMGSALTSEEELPFRNLGGSATTYRAIGPDAGTLHTTVKVTQVSSVGGMIIQNYDFTVHCAGHVVYQGDTYFGFFTRSALAQQVGIREAALWVPDSVEGSRITVENTEYPRQDPFPDRMLRMIDWIDFYQPQGGPHGLGLIQGSKAIDPDEWFFQAHFYQDPVWPGSLGLEAFLQLLRFDVVARWGRNDDNCRGSFQVHPTLHRWQYRGQVLPQNQKVTVQAAITAVDDDSRCVRADGWLAVDGKIIYQMNDFAFHMETASR